MMPFATVGSALRLCREALGYVLSKGGLSEWESPSVSLGFTAELGDPSACFQRLNATAYSSI